MTAKKTDAQKDDETENDRAAQQSSPQTKTTKQVEDEQKDLENAKVEKVDDDDRKPYESDSDDDGEHALDNVDSDSGVSGATGFVRERDREGNKYEVPYTYVTPAVDEETGHSLVRTSDTDDPARTWTAQDAGEREDEEPVALVEVQGEPGQTFRVDELPDREVVEAAGIDYDQWIAGLPVRADVPDEAPRRGIPA